uniref:Uncharacterized protein n=1 Tax=viral metagenome TaxID=1070528 RepID=A0A6C0IZK9_9ZZZZ
MPLTPFSGRPYMPKIPYDVATFDYSPAVQSVLDVHGKNINLHYVILSFTFSLADVENVYRDVQVNQNGSVTIVHGITPYNKTKNYQSRVLEYNVSFEFFKVHGDLFAETFKQHVEKPLNAYRRQMTEHLRATNKYGSNGPIYFE